MTSACNASIAVNACIGGMMASLTIRGIDDLTKERLRKRAAQHGISMEEEARRALQNWVSRNDASEGIGTRIRRRFAPLGGVELDVPLRTGDDRPLPDIFEER
jgi:plasmid stability protein